MKCEMKTITPTMAREMLSKNASNFRRANIRVVARYADDMRFGRWHVNGASIVFGRDGNLIDGQHRLLACIESDRPFRTLVVTDCESEEGIDDGRARTAAQWFEHMDISCSKDVASTARLILMSLDGSISKKSVATSYSNAMLKEFVSENKDAISDAVRMTTHQKHLPRSVLGMTLFRGTEEGFSIPSLSKDAVEFVTGIYTGAELSRGDPRLTLRDRMSHQTSHMKIDRVTIRAITIIAWNKWVRHERSLNLAWRPAANQLFPDILQACE